MKSPTRKKNFGETRAEEKKVVEIRAREREDMLLELFHSFEVGICFWRGRKFYTTVTKNIDEIILMSSIFLKTV